jgi:hypothetical protein
VVWRLWASFKQSRIDVAKEGHAKRVKRAYKGLAVGIIGVSFEPNLRGRRQEVIHS